VNANKIDEDKKEMKMEKAKKGDTLLMYLKQEKIGDELVPSKLPNQDLAPLFHAHRMYESLKIEQINRIT